MPLDIRAQSECMRKRSGERKTLTEDYKKQGLAKPSRAAFSVIAKTCHDPKKTKEAALAETLSKHPDWA